MPIILAGRLAMTISRIPGLAHEPLNAEACATAVEKATAGVRIVRAVREALRRLTPVVLDRGKPTPLVDDTGGLWPAPASPAGKLEVLLRSRGAPQVGDEVKAAYVTPQLPSGALLRPDERLELPGDVFIASPELAFFVESRTMKLPVALVVALELCGTYDLAPSFLPAGNAGSFLTNAKVAMTPASLARFADSLPPKTKGRANALAVSSLAACGSASPMESRLYCALALPVRNGGYGISGLRLNEPIELNGEDRAALGTQAMRVDLMAASDRVGIEYESQRWHETGVNQQRVRLDKKRIAIAQFHGVTLLPLTWDVVRDPALFHPFVREFMRLDGSAYREPGEQAQLQRYELHQQLFDFGARRHAA